jgi:glutathione S-transferase
LGYWVIRGLAAPIRYLLAYCNVDFNVESYRAGPAPDFSKASWLEKKFTLGLDFPNLPYFFDGSTKLTETDTIMRYIATKWKPELLGLNLVEQTNLSMMTGVIRDINKILYGSCYDGTPREITKKMSKKKVQYISTWLSKNKYAGGANLSYIDFVLYECIELLDLVYQKKLYEEFPIFKEYHD